MKKFKKYPRKQLEKFSTIFAQLGLVLVLFIVFVTLEHQTEKKEQAILTSNPDDQKSVVVYDYIPQEIVIERQAVQQPQQRQPLVLNEPIVVDNDTPVEETIVTPEDEPVKVSENEIVEVEIPEDIDKSDEPVGINFVQKTPVFKGCEGLAEAENRQCFEKKMKQIVTRHFNTELADEIGLRAGKKKIITQFVIDKNGTIVDVKIRAPHPRLEQEAKRIIKKIPPFTPGEQNNQKVKVKYTLPISFMVE